MVPAAPSELGERAGGDVVIWGVIVSRGGGCGHGAAAEMMDAA